MYPDSSVAGQAKALLERLQAGEPPSTGLRKWLPEFMTTAPEDRKAAEPAEAMPHVAAPVKTLTTTHIGQR